VGPEPGPCWRGLAVPENEVVLVCVWLGRTNRSAMLVALGGDAGRPVRIGKLPGVPPPEPDVVLEMLVDRLMAPLARGKACNDSLWRFLFSVGVNSGPSARNLSESKDSRSSRAKFGCVR
jgi:hypothetical protein